MANKIEVHCPNCGHHIFVTNRSLRWAIKKYGIPLCPVCFTDLNENRLRNQLALAQDSTDREE